jgi:hypothetical protein
MASREAAKDGLLVRSFIFACEYAEKRLGGPHAKARSREGWFADEVFHLRVRLRGEEVRWASREAAKPRSREGWFAGEIFLLRVFAPSRAITLRRG